MSNVLSNEQRQQILALGRLGWTLRRIEQATGSRRETVSAYLKGAGLAVRGPGRPATQAAKPAISGEVSPDSAAAHPATTGAVSTDAVPPGRAPTASACEPFCERIEAALTQGRNAVAIYQDRVSDHGFPASYASVRRFVRRLRGRRSVEARVVITTAPGEEGQVDYGSGPMVRDPHSGRYRRTRLFAFTLGYSRTSVRLLVWRSTTQIWAELHERAFRRLGGTVRVVVHDNLREGVLTPDIYDPTLTPLYRDVLAHDGVIALPCRVRDPDRKGTVEARIGHAQKTPLKGLRFETRIGAQAYLDRWETRWADTRIHGTTNRQVAAMFAEERPALGPLPLEPFRYDRHGVRTVHLDGCVEVEAAYVAKMMTLLLESLDRAVSKTVFPVSKAPSMSLLIEKKTQKTRRGRGPYPEMVVQLEQIVRKRERQGDGILRKVRQRIFLALLPLLCVVRICGLGVLVRWIGRRVSVSHVWTGICSGALEPPCTEPYARWCGRTGGVTLPPTRSCVHAISVSASVSQWSTSRRISSEPPPNFNSGRDIPFLEACQLSSLNIATVQRRSPTVNRQHTRRYCGTYPVGIHSPPWPPSGSSGGQA